MTFKEYCKKVGLNVKTQFTPKISSAYGSTRVYKGRDGHKISAVVLHTTGNAGATAQNEADNLYNNNGVNSFHAVADANGVIETAAFANATHHAGDKYTNLRTLGFELSDYQNNAAAGYGQYIKYIGYVFYQLGLTPNHDTVLFHNEIVSTSCGAYLRGKGKDAIIADIKHYMNIAKGGSASKPKPEVKPQPKPKPKPKPQVSDKQYINIHPGHADKYGIYSPDQVPVAKNIKRWLLPNKLGGLSYEIIDKTGYPNVYVINTRDYGRSLIYLDETRATITGSPVYTLYGTNGATTAPKPKPAAIKVGDTVKVLKAEQYGGGSFHDLEKKYKVIELVGERAVIASLKSGAVFAAVNVKNLARA